MHDVIVCDEEFSSASNEISAVCRKLDQHLDIYLQIMTAACSNDVMDGASAKALRTFVSYAKGLKRVLSEIADQNKQATELFLKAVNETDDYLY